MKDSIQQELEKLDIEQLKQVFEFISFLKFRARLATIPAIDETNLAALYCEFAEEDRQFVELGISEYAELLKHENSLVSRLCLETDLPRLCLEEIP
ncbi:hypothetical protein [Microcoleus sp. BROC3]|uniref:hypothetical protein n=1 Tax=Microcoleus sp. BROC3 TaxID=3055323 RepID=UPI002FD73BFC